MLLLGYVGHRNTLITHIPEIKGYQLLLWDPEQGPTGASWHASWPHTCGFWPSKHFGIKRSIDGKAVVTSPQQNTGPWGSKQV